MPYSTYQDQLLDICHIDRIKILAISILRKAQLKNFWHQHYGGNCFISNGLLGKKSSYISRAQYNYQENLLNFI